MELSHHQSELSPTCFSRTLSPLATFHSPSDTHFLRTPPRARNANTYAPSPSQIPVTAHYFVSPDPTMNGPRTSPASYIRWGDAGRHNMHFSTSTNRNGRDAHRLMDLHGADRPHRFSADDYSPYTSQRRGSIMYPSSGTTKNSSRRHAFRRALSAACSPVTNPVSMDFPSGTGARSPPEMSRLAGHTDPSRVPTAATADLRMPANRAHPQASTPRVPPSPPRRCPQEPPLDLVPPFRFATVEAGVYRGAYPTLRNFGFLQRLRLRTILSLTPEEPSYDLRCFAAAHNITLKHIQAERFKGEIQLLPTEVTDALQTILSANNHPLYLHCLDGRHVIGVIVMALRKLQLWTPISSDAEYVRFTKERHDEVAFIADYSGPLVLPNSLPPWLWEGSWKDGMTGHPKKIMCGIKLRFPDQSTTVSDPITPALPNGAGPLSVPPNLVKDPSPTVGVDATATTPVLSVPSLAVASLREGGLVDPTTAAAFGFRTSLDALSRDFQPPSSMPPMEYLPGHGMYMEASARNQQPDAEVPSERTGIVHASVKQSSVSGDPSPGYASGHITTNVSVAASACATATVSPIGTPRLTTRGQYSTTVGSSGAVEAPAASTAPKVDLRSFSLRRAWINDKGDALLPSQQQLAPHEVTPTLPSGSGAASVLDRDGLSGATPGEGSTTSKEAVVKPRGDVTRPHARRAKRRNSM